jgi:hypothetical protein
MTTTYWNAIDRCHLYCKAISPQFLATGFFLDSIEETEKGESG